MGAPSGSIKLDPTWQVGIGWGVVIVALTVAGIYVGVRMDSTTATGLGILGWLGFLAWLEKGVTK